MNQARLLVIAASMGVVGVGQVRGQVFEWSGTAGANWAVDTNWDVGMVPAGAGAVAQIDAFAGMVVLNTNVPDIGSIENLDPASTVSVDPGGRLTLLGGPSVNNGVIEFNRFGSSIDGTFEILGAVSLGGSGEVRMRASFGNAVILGAGTLTNGAGHEIRGVGQIFTPIVNNGRLAADDAISVSGSELEILADVTNLSDIASADTGSILEILPGTTITNTGGGRIVAEGGNVVLQGGSAVVGGEITDIGSTGAILSGNNNQETVFESVTNTGMATTIRPGGRISVFGSGLLNNGMIQLNPVGSSIDSVITFVDSGALGGSGEIRMRSGFGNTQLNTAVGEQITHAASHTIRGVGEINSAMANAGTISADVSVSVSGNTLELQTEDKPNTGLLSAEAGSVLSIESIAIAQAGGGEIRANAGGVVQFTGASEVTDGTITSDPAGSVNVRGASATTLDNVAIDAQFVIDPNGTVFVGPNGIVNSALIAMNPTGSSANSILEVLMSAELSGSGEVRMSTSADNTQINTAPGQVLTNAATHTIRGVGQINANVVNNGVISADVGVSVSGAILELQGEPKVNNGLFSAETGTTLQIEGIAVSQSAGGVIAAEDSGLVVVTPGSSITDGILMTTGTGRIRTSGGLPSMLSGVALDGVFQIDPAGRIDVDAGNIVNNGLIEMNRFGSAADSVLTLDNATIAGTGEIQMRTSAGNSRIETAPGSTATLGAGQLLRGVGEINALLINEGEIRADVGVSVSGASLELQTEDKVNNGAIVSAAGTTLFIQGIEVDQTGGGSILADEGVVALDGGATIVGGTLSSTGAGVWGTAAGGFAVDGTMLSGSGFVNPGHTMTVLGGTLLNDALIRGNTVGSAADSIIALPQDTTLAGSGTISFETSGANTRFTSTAASGVATLTNAPGHSVVGVGEVQVPFVNEGVLRPGSVFGTMSSTADTTFASTSTFIATLGGNNQNGRYASSGSVTLGGTLDVVLADGVSLANGFDHVIVDAASVNGVFATLNLIVEGELITRIVYEPDRVVLRTRCKADVNLDGLVNPADFNAWIAAYNTQDPTADQNLDGLINPADFNAWIVNFNRPCP